MQEIFLPDFIGESDLGLIIMVSQLDTELDPLYKSFHGGEEIEYWFGWDLIETSERGYLVVLGVNWGDDQGVIIGFTPDMWEILKSVREREHVALMTDWRLITEGESAAMDDMGRFRPRALVLRDAYRGMDILVQQAADIAPPEGPGEELERLLGILAGFMDKKKMH